MTSGIHLLPRTGDTPLRFTGDQIAHVTGRTEGARADRWFEITIYEVENGSFESEYVLRIVYQSNWHRDEKPHHHVVLIEADSDEEAGREIMDELDNFDPVGPHFIGFPPLPKFRDRDRELRNKIQKQFIDLVGELMAQDECAERFAQEI